MEKYPIWVGMSFEITVVSNTPLTPINDLDEVTIQFLTQIGYFSKGYDPKTDAKTVKESVPYRLLRDCFFKRMSKGWTVEQLSLTGFCERVDQ